MDNMDTIWYHIPPRQFLAVCYEARGSGCASGLDSTEAIL